MIKEYRDITMRIDKLPKGHYVIIPCCKTPGETGKYFLNIYYNYDEEKKEIVFSKGRNVFNHAMEVIAEEDEGVR